MFAGGRIGVVLVVGWTLIFEMFFYLVFSIGIWTKVNRLRFLSIAMGLVAIIGLFPKGSWAVALYVADPIVLEFLAGAWIAEIMVKRGRVFPPGVAVAMAAAWCVYMAHFPQNGIGPLRMLTAGLPAILLVAAVISLENVLHFRIPRWLRTLGDGSYSIYLIHGLILPVIGFLMVKGGFSGPSGGGAADDLSQPDLQQPGGHPGVPYSGTSCDGVAEEEGETEGSASCSGSPPGLRRCNAERPAFWRAFCNE